MSEQLPGCLLPSGACTIIRNIETKDAASKQTRSERFFTTPPATPPDESIRPLLDSAKRHPQSPTVVNGALASLVELTEWQSQNQRAVVDTDGLCTLFALLKQASNRHHQDPETTKLVLWLLMNLAANDTISPKIAAEPGCVKSLVTLLGAEDDASRQCAVFSTRCLINLTCSNAAAQEAAFQAGALKATSQRLMQESDDGACKVYTWLLCSLTSSHLSQARAAIATDPELVQRLLKLLLNRSKPSAGSTAAWAASTLSNVARGGPACQAALIQAGACKQLLACLSGPVDRDPQLAAAVLEALATLAVEQPDCADAMLSDPRLIPLLEAIARQGSPARTGGQDRCWTKKATAAAPIEGHLLLAAHVLVHVLAYSSGAAHKPGAAANQRGVEGRRPAPGGGTVPDALYMTLEEAARRIHVRLAGAGAGAAGAPLAPQPAAGHMALDGDEQGCSEDLLLALPAIELAELLHTIHDVLLPRMREPNSAAAADAIAQLHQLAAGQGAPGCMHASACVQLMAEAGLVHQLVALLAERDARLSTACLCLLDRMSANPRCRALLAETNWLDAVAGLLESPDRVVRLLARRALCSIHAQEL